MEEQPEFKRVQYHLKMALRLVNTSFQGFQVVQFNQPNSSIDKDTNKTAV
jgi:hypothetical protein